MGAEGSFIPLRLVLLLLPVIWNGSISVLALFNRRVRGHRVLNVAVDILFCLLLFVTTGGFASQIFWVGLLPLFSAAVYYGIRGSLLVGLVVSLLQIGAFFVPPHAALPWLPMGTTAGFNVLVGGLVALCIAPVVRRLRYSYQNLQTKRKEGEQNAQRQERDRMRALFTMVEAFSSTLNYQTVLETALDAAITAVDGGAGTQDMVGVVLLFGGKQDLEVRAARGLIAHDCTVNLPAEQGVLHEALQSGAVRAVTMPGQDPELGKLLTLQERQSALCLPLIRGMTAYGFLIFAHTQGNFFTTERTEMLEMLANQAVIALQNARLYQDLAGEKERILQSQEEAQKKLARNLHDGPTQSISAIAMRINITRRILQKTPAEAAIQEANDELVKVEDLARRTTNEIRHMLFTLRPLVLESEGLEAALQTMSEKMRELYQQNVVVDADQAAVAMLDPSRQTVMFALAEEAVNNARKHAKASEILVRIKTLPRDPCIAILEIADNGVGFDVQAVMKTYDRRGSLGMINLQERAELIGGVLKIDSIQGKGTRIRVLIPLSDEASDRLHHLR